MKKMLKDKFGGKKLRTEEKGKEKLDKQPLFYFSSRFQHVSLLFLNDGTKMNIKLNVKSFPGLVFFPSFQQQMKS